MWIAPRRGHATAVAFDLGGTASERRRLYDALADLLAAALPGATVAVERAATAPGPRMVVRPVSVATALLAQPALRALVRPPSADVGAPDPPHRRIAALIPGAATADRAAPRLPSVDRTAPDGVAGGTVRLDVQTFWSCGPDRRLWLARWLRLSGDRAGTVASRFEAVATAAAAEWGRALGVPVTYRELRWGRRSAWARLSPGSVPRAAWTTALARPIDGAAEPESPPVGGTASGHALVLGASGAGKTFHLADRAAAAARGGQAVVILDVHGDLSGAFVARLSPEERARVIGIDLARPPFPGIAAIDPRAPTDRAVAHVVAALKRLTPDGTEIYWGFRLERLLEAFVRLAHEGGGTLRDAYALLTDAERRDAARLATRSRDLAQFLDELEPVVRRTPDFLWGAAARLAKVVSVPALAQLLAPDDGGLPIEDLLAEGRPIVVRLPYALLGPDAASFAASLVLGRLYYGSSVRATDGPGRPGVLAVLDEVQGLSPRLVAEIYAEGRKFGWHLAAATQYPERLAPELRASAAADVDEIVAFRLPAPAAAESGPWVGLVGPAAARILPRLAPGAAIAAGRQQPDPWAIAPGPVPADCGTAPWGEITSTARLGLEPSWSAPREDTGDATTERILLAIFAAREAGGPIPAGGAVEAARRLPGPDLAAEAIDDRVGTLGRDRSIELRPDGWALTPAGERRLGLGRGTAAVRESSEHRRLLLAAFRVFARRGYRLEIVRQGRFDVRLPDARFRQLPDRGRSRSPASLADDVDRARSGWAWRYFAGRDVHVEAEVSGALRTERIRRGLEKARAQDAAVLFVVSDLRRAARIRSVLRASGIGPRDGCVWVLPPSDRECLPTASGAPGAPGAAGAVAGS